MVNKNKWTISNKTIGREARIFVLERINTQKFPNPRIVYPIDVVDLVPGTFDVVIVLFAVEAVPIVTNIGFGERTAGLQGPKGIVIIGGDEFGVEVYNGAVVCGDAIAFVADGSQDVTEMIS